MFKSLQTLNVHHSPANSILRIKKYLFHFLILIYVSLGSLNEKVLFLYLLKTAQRFTHFTSSGLEFWRVKLLWFVCNVRTVPNFCWDIMNFTCRFDPRIWRLSHLQSIFSLVNLLQSQLDQMEKKENYAQREIETSLS